MCATKTPRTLIGEYLDASQTQTQAINRQRGRIVRTPDLQTQSTERKLKHDRVSSLRSKRRSFSAGMDEEPTPRQLIEGFLEGNDSTAPLLRHKRRTSQSGLSSSQPALPVSGKRSSTMTTGNRTMDADNDTPRTLIQRFLHNATDMIETPLGSNQPPLPQYRTPEIPTDTGSYHTPSPFKASSVESSSNTMSASSSRRKTPRSTKGKFNISVPDKGDNLSSSLEDVTPPTNDYDVPSQFLDSSESDLFESQNVVTNANRTARNRGKFNITVPAHLVDELSRRQQSHDNDEDNDYQMNDSKDGDDGDNEEYRDQEDPMVVQETYHTYELPLKPGGTDNNGERASFGDNEDDQEDEGHEIMGRSAFDSVEDDRRRSDINRSNQTKGDYTADRVSLDSRADASRRGVAESRLYSVGDRVERRSLNDLESEVVMETSLTIPETQEEIFETKDGSFVDRYGRLVDISRLGRRSEGHNSRFESHKNDRRGRMSEGHSRSGEGNFGEFFSPRQQHENSKKYSEENERSSSSLIYTGRRWARQSSDSVKQSRTERVTEGHVVSSGNVLESRGHNPETEDVIYYNDKMGGHRTDHIHTLPNTTANFSPRISSTQKLVTVDGGVIVDHIHTLPNTTANFSPRISSTQKLVTVDGSVIDDSPLQTVTPSPVVSPRVGSRTSRSVTPNSSAGRSMRSVDMNTPRSSSSIISSRRSGDMNTPQSSRSVRTSERSGDMNISQSSSLKRTSRRSGEMTPQSTRIHRSTARRSTSSPQSSVSDRSTNRSVGEMSKSSVTSRHTQNKSGARASPERSNTNQSTPRSGVMSPPKNLGTDRSMRRRSGMPQSSSRSVSRSGASPMTTGRSLASPVVAGRIEHRLGSVQGLPNNTAFFSPQVASTQNVAAISRLSHPPGAPGTQEDMENDRDVEDDQWQDEEMEVDEDEQTTHLKPGLAAADNTAAKAKKAARKPRQKSKYSLPVSVVKKHFTHFAGMRVSKEAIEEVMKASEKYWDNLAADLDAYAKHAGRKKIQMADFALLFKRQGLVNDKVSLNSLIAKYLPMEESEKLIHVARAGNRIDPKL